MKTKLVAYFSCTGTTQRIAEAIAREADADLFEIHPKKPYTAKDLDWTDRESRSSVEMRDKNSRPEIVGRVENMAQYDTVYLGFPIWWYIAPTIINTFLESYDFSGKTVVLFATSGGSGFGTTLAELRRSVDKSCKLREGAVLNRANESRIKALVDSTK